jgi:uncharacterized protein YdeI (BOF family)
MNKREAFKYAAVFGAGVFAVLGVIGFTSLIQPSAVAPVAANQQPAEAGLLAPSGPNQALDPAADTATAGSGPAAGSPADQQPQKQTRNSSASSQSAAAQTLGAGTVVDGVTSISDLARNTMVTVEGTVTRINDEDEFIIADSTGSIQIYTGRSYFTVDQGQRVSVRGLVDDGVLLEIYADEIVLPDGSVVEVRHWG